jgi:hypothetical protein
VEIVAENASVSVCESISPLSDPVLVAGVEVSTPIASTPTSFRLGVEQFDAATEAYDLMRPDDATDIAETTRQYHEALQTLERALAENPSERVTEVVNAKVKEAKKKLLTLDGFAAEAEESSAFVSPVDSLPASALQIPTDPLPAGQFYVLYNAELCRLYIEESGIRVQPEVEDDIMPTIPFSQLTSWSGGTTQVRISTRASEMELEVKDHAASQSVVEAMAAVALLLHKLRTPLLSSQLKKTPPPSSQLGSAPTRSTVRSNAASRRGVSSTGSSSDVDGPSKQWRPKPQPRVRSAGSLPAVSNGPPAISGNEKGRNKVGGKGTGPPPIPKKTAGVVKHPMIPKKSAILRTTAGVAESVAERTEIAEADPPVDELLDFSTEPKQSLTESVGIEHDESETQEEEEEEEE